MKCAVLTRPGNVEIQDLPQPVPAAGEVLIEVETAALCGSDHSLYRGKLDGHLPLIPGHEAVGRIAGSGEGVSGPSIGRRVVIQPNFSCRTCSVCQSGMENTCPEKIRLGVDVNGVFAQYTAVPAHYVWPVPDSLENEVAIFTEPMAVAFHAIGKCSPEKGQKVLVFGTGVFGLIVTQLIALQGYDVVVFDLVKKRLDLAEDLGARAGIQDLGALPDHGPFDVIFEASGAPEALSHAIELAAPGGRIVLGGLPADPYPVLSTRIVRKELRIFGSIIYTNEFPAVLDMLETGNFKTKPLISGIIPLEELSEALEGFQKPERIKTIIRIKEQ